MQIKLTDVAAILLTAITLVPWGGGGETPGAPVIPAPSVEVQTAVGPITMVLAGHGDEAKELAAFYHAAAEVVRRDGAGGKVVKNTSHLRTFCERAATLRFQGAFQKVPGLSDAIHGPNGALANLLKLDVIELDHGKTADVLNAVAWACQEAAR